MNDSLRSTVTALASVLVVGFVLAACTEGDTTIMTGESAMQAGIAVSGTGEASAPPDMAVLSLGIEVSSGSVADARERAAVAASRLIAAVEDNGVKDRDIQTQSISVYPQYDYSKPGTPVITGYVVQNVITVRVRELDRLSEVIDDALEAAGDAARVQGLRFTFSDREELLKTARERAVADARTRAETYAAAAGVRLGTVIAITETVSDVPVEPVLASAPRTVADVSTPIEVGESTVTVTVSVRYALEP